MYVEFGKYGFEMHPRTDAPVGCSRGAYLSDVYDSWSTNKQRAYDHCREMYNDLDGWDFSITSANTFTFVVEFDFQNPDTGEIMHAVITKEHNHLYYK